MNVTEADYHPVFDPTKAYVFRGRTLTKLFAMIRRNRLKAGANVTIDVREEGSFISSHGIRRVG